MDLFKALCVLAGIVAATSANRDYERFKIFNFNGESEPYRKPWFFESFSIPNTHPEIDESSSFTDHKSDGYERIEKPGTQAHRQVYENPAEAYFVASTKKIPHEDKNFKKAVSAFYTLTDKDNPKYKEIILKSGAPYCEETKTNASNNRNRRDATTCYKCKDPKNGATYEQCSYTSEPHETVVVKGYVTEQHEQQPQPQQQQQQQQPQPQQQQKPLPAVRYRRSNSAADLIKENEKHPIVQEMKMRKKKAAGVEDDFRFGEEYFKPAASEEVVKDYQKEMEHCDKVVKGTMVCMVCKHPQGTGKYEQCSYTKQPNEKAFAYAKSSTYGVPGSGETAEEQRVAGALESTQPTLKSSRGGPKGGNVEEVTEASPRDKPRAAPTRYSEADPENVDVEKLLREQIVPSHEESDGYDSPSGTSAEAVVDSGTSKDGCKKIRKDNMICTVCKDPKTGGNYEQCSYAHQPNDKVYQFSRSKSFGYPEAKDDESKEKSGKYDYGSEEDASKQHYTDESKPYGSQDYKYSPYDSAEESYGEIGQPSESERISAATKKTDCRKVEKDSMTCTICKDPKTGGDFEQCSYAYQPKDKVFSFSRAKSFGSQDPDGQDGNASAEQYGQSDFGNDGSGYGVASSGSEPYVSSAPLLGSSSEEAEKKQASTAVEIPAVKGPEEVKIDFFGTTEKKKEIAKVLSEFQQEDRSKCKKVIKDKLTCFQCLDEKGMQTEECLFVAEQEPLQARVAYRESKEFERQPESAAAAAGAETRFPKVSYAEPASAASETDEEQAEPEGYTADDEEVEQRAEKLRGQNYARDEGPPDFAEITKPTYDKSLGLTLPRYMLETSEHEADFDEVVAGSKINF